MRKKYLNSTLVIAMAAIIGFGICGRYTTTYANVIDMDEKELHTNS